MNPQLVKALAGVVGSDSAGPFGDAALRSNRIKAGVSRGLQAAANNLLAKALRAVVAGDEARATGYVQRAVRLPVDEHEEVHPGSWAAAMLLFEAVTDALEACDEDDTAWLDAAERVLGTASDDGRHALLNTLRIITGDYSLPRAEVRRIDNLVYSAEPEFQPRPDSPAPAATVPAILAVVKTVVAYDDALGA